MKARIGRFVDRQPRGQCFPQYGAVAFLLALALGAAPAGLKAQQNNQQPLDKVGLQVQMQTASPPQSRHRFFDKTNLMLFGGVAAVRALDFTSTQDFRRLGNNEVLLTNNIVDNKLLFAGIEVAGTALSIGVAYWLHRKHHHKLERWVSITHISVGTFGVAHNYSLGPPH